MIRIALCDDVSVQLAMVDDIVRSYFHTNDIEVETKLFSGGEQLIGYVEENGFFDMYILDMIMPGIKGIEIGQKLRRMGDHGKIVYLTATSEYAVESYEVDAFFYLLKPISVKAIHKVLDKAVILSGTPIADVRKLEIKTREGKRIINFADINYVDIVNRGLCYHMTDKALLEGPMLRIPFAESVHELMDCDSFIMGGSSLLVNSSNIDTADKTRIVFKNAEELFPSRKAGQDLYNQLKAY